MSLNFAMFLLERGLIDEVQICSALKEVQASQTPLGELAMRQQKMTMSQVYEVLRLQAGSSVKFGDLAISCGYLTRAALAELIFVQSEEQRSLIEVLIGQRAIDPESVEILRAEYHHAMLAENQRFSLRGALQREPDLTENRFAIWESRS